jgi:hypothetical protein
MVVIGSEKEEDQMPYCTVPAHRKRKIKLVCPACIAARGAGVPKPASARNGRLGGRPPKHRVGCNAQTTGMCNDGCPRCKYDANRLADKMLKPRSRARRRNPQ